jgi:hypothetical protein
MCGRVDLSNIHNVGDAVAIPRLKSAIRGFVRETYDLRENYQQILGLGEAEIENICLGLAIEWIKSYNENPSAKRVGAGGTLNRSSRFIRSITTQAIYEVQREGTGIQGASFDTKNYVAVEHALKEFGFHINNLQINNGTAQSILSALSEKGEYLPCLTGFGVGHAIALHNGGEAQDVIWFDSSAGEFIVGNGDFEYFYDAVIEQYSRVGMQFFESNVFHVI